MSEEKYNGWTNYETWAVKLHWDNDEGNYSFFTGEAEEHWKRGEESFQFADFLKEQAEKTFHEFIFGDKPKIERDSLFVFDVGSLWRVNWMEIAEAYYEDAKSSQKDEEESKKESESNEK